jgi:hypothetical protein
MNATQDCFAGTYIAAVATSSTDRICTACQTGKFSTGDRITFAVAENVTLCQFHAEACENRTTGDTIEIAEPTPTSDRNCTAPPAVSSGTAPPAVSSGSRGGAAIAIGSVVVVLVIVAGVFFYRKRQARAGAALLCGWMFVRLVCSRLRLT